MPSHLKRKVAPHVQATIAAGQDAGQAKAGEDKRTVAPHVQAVIAAGQGAGQAKIGDDKRTLAPHVRAVIAAGGDAGQPKIGDGKRAVAPHVQIAVTTAQAKIREPGDRREAAKHVPAGIAVQPKADRAQGGHSVEPIASDSSGESSSFGSCIQCSSDEDYVDSEEELRREEKEYEDQFSEDEYHEPFDKAPTGYMSVRQYSGRLSKKSNIEDYDDVIWVKPVRGGVCIYFKKKYVSDTKWAKPTDQREESKNRGDINLTWHHTCEFSGKKCFMQLVPTKYHAKIGHVGGVALK